MKIYIVGSVASGKSTLAKQIAQQIGIKCHSLDEVVHKSDPTNPWGNVKRPVAERERIFDSILQNQHYIIEDTGRACFERGFSNADQIVLLDIPFKVRKRRIITRWIKQNIGLESCTYKPRYRMLKSMIQWAKDYDNGKDGLRKRLQPYKEKVIILRDGAQIDRYITELNCIKLRQKMGKNVVSNSR